MPLSAQQRLLNRTQRQQQIIAAQHQTRQHAIAASPQAVERCFNDKTLLNFCSNDYLGLANHVQVKQAFTQGINTWGVGSGAAQLVNGHTQAHHELAEQLADWLGYEAVLLFSTGYMANLALASGLFGHQDRVIQDRLNHASLLDASFLQLGRQAVYARKQLANGLLRYHHANPLSLQKALTSKPVTQSAVTWVVTDGVFSMDGDIAPLADLMAVCQTSDALLIVDDAHGLGVLGEQGRGCTATQAIKPEVLIGTLGKAFGGSGAFIASSQPLIETLIQHARTYIYTTAMPAAMAVAMQTSLKIIQTEAWRRQHLTDLHDYFLTGAAELGLDIQATPSAIQPVIVGDSKTALNISQALLEKGLQISAIRPPTVPKGQARLRITFSAEQTFSHVDQLLDALNTVLD